MCFTLSPKQLRETHSLLWLCKQQSDLPDDS